MTLLPGFRWNLPNALSLFRIACAPVMLLAAAQAWERLFIVLFVLAQLSDILDGVLARALKQESEAGALLDSYGDLGSYLCAFAGLLRFHMEIFRLPYGPWLGAFVFLYFLGMAITRWKFGRLVAGLHLYSSKITGYLQGTFLVVLFVWGMAPAFFYLMIGAGILSELEVIVLNLLTRRPATNAKGLYWMIREGRLK